MMSRVVKTSEVVSQSLLLTNVHETFSVCYSSVKGPCFAFGILLHIKNIKMHSWLGKGNRHIITADHNEKVHSFSEVQFYNRHENLKTRYVFYKDFL